MRPATLSVSLVANFVPAKYETPGAVRKVLGHVLFPDFPSPDFDLLFGPLVRCSPCKFNATFGDLHIGDYPTMKIR